MSAADPATPAAGGRTALIGILEHVLARDGATLLLLDADDFAAVAARIGPVRANALLGALAHRLASCAEPDVRVSRAGADALAAVLPGADATAAESLFARLQANLQRDPPRDGPVGVSAGIATAGPGEGAAEFLGRASVALRAAKQAGKGTAQAGSLRGQT